MTRLGVSTSSFFPLPLEDSFRLAKDAGAEAIEVMITNNPETYDPGVLDFLSRRFDLPIVSVHAPVLILTQGVFGFDPAEKLIRTAELATALGADTVVVHPPFCWQWAYSIVFVDTVKRVAETFGLTVAVENMFGWTVSRWNIEAYSPNWNPGELDLPNLTLDFSHAAMQGVSSLDLANQWGSRLSHIHLCDGTSPRDNFHLFDEHLVPGRGSQPVARTLEALGQRGFSGHVIAEVSTKNGRTDFERVDMVRSSLDFARFHLSSGRPAEAVEASG